jgi:phosphoesterase RecJ-like protein
LNPKFLELLSSRPSFLLSGHEHPDGDCVGAQVALYHLLRSLGAEVRILNPDPVARALRFLADRTPIGNFRDDPDLPAFDVLVLLDCATVSRLGELGRRIRGMSPSIAVIDHHVGSENGDGDCAYVDVSAAATGVLVYNLYEHFEVAIPEIAAEAIFVSIVSDTGWFKYSNTDARTLRIVAELIDIGVEPDDLYDRLYRRNDPRSVGLLSACLAHHEFRIGGAFAVGCLDNDLVTRSSRAGFETDTVLEPLRSVEGVEVAALFKELPDGSVKLSLRAMGDVDVQQIATGFGGGGHKKAAGATIPMTMAAAVDAVEAKVRRALESD